MGTEEVNDLISSHETLEIVIYAQLTTQDGINVQSAETFCQRVLII